MGIEVYSLVDRIEGIDIPPKYSIIKENVNSNRDKITT
jgi:hypothetical protein